jgi:hypothetical protein
MDLTNYITILPITIICLLIGMGLKQINKIPNKFIPVIVGFIGGLIAIPAMYIMKDFPANDVITAISIGIMSGLSSTGVHQVYKQTTKSE